MNSATEPDRQSLNGSTDRQTPPVDHIARLQELAAALAQAASPEPVAAVIVTHGLAALDANAGTVYLLHEGSAEFVALCIVGYPPGVTEDWQRFPVAVPVPIADAVRERKPVILATLEERAARYPLLDDLGKDGAMVALPLLLPGGSFGGVGFSFASDRNFTDQDRAFMVALAGLGTAALGRARLAADDAERQKRVADLEEVNRRMDEFLAVLAHELRNPLAPIRDAVQVMRRQGQTDSTFRWSADVIERQVQHLAHLVDDLLDAAQIMRGKIRLRKERVELAQCLAQAVEACGPFVEARKQKLEVTLTSKPVRLEADPKRLKQVVGNLLSNATKYTPEGGHISVAARQEGDEIVLVVKDNGIGIRSDMLARIFELFMQGEPAFRQSQGGLGIGLTVVRALVELHGGTVKADSPGPGLGSEFVVRLPALPEPQVPADGEAAEEAPSIPSRRVLVVDDNLDAGESLAMLLRLEGHEVHVAHEGSTTLGAALAFRPDVVLLDISLPGGPSGYDLAPRLRELPGLGNMLLVALTGYGQEEDRGRALDAGFDAHLVKPADLNALHALLANAPGKR